MQFSDHRVLERGTGRQDCVVRSFLFTETPRAETDRSKLKDKPDTAIVAKKRYLLGPNFPDHDAAWHGKVSVTAGAEGDTEFWIPKGGNLFHFGGGARFVHGGAMPQEIVVPVIIVKHVRGKSAQDTKTRPVEVQGIWQPPPGHQRLPAGTDRILACPDSKPK